MKQSHWVFRPRIVTNDNKKHDHHDYKLLIDFVIFLIISFFHAIALPN
jgi:hypothetical protein